MARAGKLIFVNRTMDAGGHHYQISELDWLKLQLRVLSLENRSENMWVVYSLSQEKSENSEAHELQIVTRIYNLKIDEILDDLNSKDELLAVYFRGWVSLEKKKIASIVKNLPHLRQEFDLERNLVFEICKDLVSSSFLICSIVGDDVSWNSHFKLPKAESSD